MICFESWDSLNKLGQFYSALVLPSALAKTCIVLWRSAAWGRKNWHNNAKLKRYFVFFLSSILIGHQVNSGILTAGYMGVNVRLCRSPTRKTLVPPK